MAEPRELFPVTFLGERRDAPQVGGAKNPDYPIPALDEIPEPTPEDIAAIEAGADEPTVGPIDAPATATEEAVTDNFEMADTPGKGKGAAAKG